MSSSFSISDTSEYREVLLHGALTKDTIMEYLLNHMDSRMPRLSLWNFLDADPSHLDESLFKEVIVLLAQKTGSISRKTAFLFKDEIDQILGHSFEKFMSKYDVPVQYSSFLNRDEALDWLTSESAD